MTEITTVWMHKGQPDLIHFAVRQKNGQEARLVAQRGSRMWGILWEFLDESYKIQAQLEKHAPALASA